MSSDIMIDWLKDGNAALINNMFLKPYPHPISPEMCLAVRRGQAVVYFLHDNNGSDWLIKKFLDGKELDPAYLVEIANILPASEPFLSGTTRTILTRDSLTKTTRTYARQELSEYLENTILMPKIKGLDWAGLACELRDSKMHLGSFERMAICRNLSVAINELEKAMISHLDLSSGNVFIVPKALSVSLIDFDSLFHPSLNRPKQVMIGSEGYIPSFVTPHKGSNWCEYADRFALSLINTEILIVDKDSPFSNEGGIFVQDDLDQKEGPSITYAIDKLQKEYPKTAALFHATIKSDSFAQCPAPDDWIAHFQEDGNSLSLDSLPEFSFELPEKKEQVSVAVKLPDNPWE